MVFLPTVTELNYILVVTLKLSQSNYREKMAFAHIEQKIRQ